MELDVIKLPSNVERTYSANPSNTQQMSFNLEKKKSISNGSSFHSFAYLFNDAVKFNHAQFIANNSKRFSQEFQDFMTDLNGT